MAVITIVAFAVAVAAAVRSTWSPCGVSMLSTITPLAETARGRRYRATATWFVAGAVVGGLGLGGVAALGAVVVSAFGPSHGVVVGVATAGALAAAALDGGLIGPRLPHHRRQVNELWLDRYRGWVYGGGFGAQIGFGLATFVMTAAVYLTVLLAALTGRPPVALTLGATFGLVRGLAVMGSARLTTPDSLRIFHQRFEAWRAPVARWAIVVEGAAAVVVAAAASPLGGAVVALAIAIVVLSRLGRGGVPAGVPADRTSVPTSSHGTVRTPAIDRSPLS